MHLTLHDSALFMYVMIIVFQNLTTNLTFFENEEALLKLDDTLNFGIVFNESCDFQTKVQIL